MKHQILQSTLLAVFGPALAGFAGQPYEALDAGDVFVATITRVEDDGATNARPPRVWLEVHEVLRGKVKIDRSPAVWWPRYHGIDYGDDDSPELRLWNAAPLKGPKVGEKYILGGYAWDAVEGEKKLKKYGLFAFVRIPFSDDARRQTIENLEALEAARRKYAAEQAAAAKERKARAQAWRAALDAATIDKRTQQADAVAIGTLVSSSTFEIERMLKGRPRMSTGGKYYVSLPVEGFDPRIADIVIDSRPRCVLFLSEENLIASVAQVHAHLVDRYEGLVVADAAAIEAVEASLEKHPAPKPRPVLVISALDRDDAPPIAAAASATFEVVLSQQFSAHGQNSVEHVRNTMPLAGSLVMIDRGPQRRVWAVRIEKASATTVYDETWPDQETKMEVDALFKTLAEQIKK